MIALTGKASPTFDERLHGSLLFAARLRAMPASAMLVPPSETYTLSRNDPRYCDDSTRLSRCTAMYVLARHVP